MQQMLMATMGTQITFSWCIKQARTDKVYVRINLYPLSWYVLQFFIYSYEDELNSKVRSEESAGGG